jgi:hypothetical protein
VTKLLTETADYDEPGSWGRMSDGWREIRGDVAYAMYVFANCAPTVPYGSYVLMDERGKYGATKSCLRIHKDHVDQLREDFTAAGSPEASESVSRRGRARRAQKWW